MRERRKTVDARGLLVCFAVMVIGAFAIALARPSLILSYGLTAVLATMVIFAAVRFSRNDPERSVDRPRPRG